jgi:hypothetical protein
MAKRTILIIVALLVLLALLFWYQQANKDNDANASVIQTVSVFNKTKNADATTIPANAGDELVYTLNVQNTSDEVISSYVVETNIADASELATLTDAQGANYNAGTNSLTWTPLDIPGNGSIERQFTVRVKDTLPAESDLLISVRYDNEVLVNVTRTAVVTPIPKPTPSPTPSPFTAPRTGPSVWFAFILAIAFTAGIVLYKASKSIKV